ncbi:MAG: hypothetical protein ABJC19_02465 [Gemmatimonadota bacterium]
MNWRGYRACVRREVRRGRRGMMVYTLLALMMLVLALVVGEEVAPVLGALSLPIAIFVLFGPSADLARDKIHGHFEFNRTLPIPPRMIAAGWLSGTAIRLLPVALIVFMSLLAFRGSGEFDTRGDRAALLLFPVLAYGTACGVVWGLLAVSARWTVRRLWWLPLSLWLLPQLVATVLPATMQASLEEWLARLGHTLVDWLGQPDGRLALGLLLLGALAMIFLASTLLFASGVVRHQYDSTGLGVILGEAPKRELEAIGAGVVLAVARLRLRLATEQFRRELIILVLLFAVAAAGPGETREWARRYIPILAALLPASVAFQLLAARTTGQLEGLQQLPQSRAAIALGHLVAIGVMAVPGALIILVTHALEGRAPTFAGAVELWGWFVVMAWAAASVGLWFRPRYLPYLIAGIIALVAGAVAVLGGTGVLLRLAGAPGSLAAWRESLGLMLPIMTLLLVGAAGVPLFAYALSRYQHRPT